ncbi:HAD family hydrolase [Mycobacterium sp. M1]|uniref:HAD family hydrolase n=1 Tax=Mycolicibacter acidiphilus TaxID=2835306 RepID=A0ABS5RKB7_9MYCO|nr:Cof-type HAD-IIB family hydrolase [Mycolicibacter acidiphilus]MBS9534680.1 HAD family hydrolase [Mycolicibacter acidiphilus]
MSAVRARLVVFDIDGTLLDPDNPVSPGTVGALRDLQDRGLQLAFASSRPIESLALFARDLGVTAHLIGFNGAVATSTAGRQLVAETFVVDTLLTELLRRFADSGGAVNVYQPAGWLAVGPAAATDHEEQATGLTADRRSTPDRLSELADESAFKVMCRGSTAARAELLSAVADLAGLTAMTSGPDCCDIQARGVDKATAMQELCQDLGITPEAVVAFGDSDSDAPMLALAGYGIAVGNATESAKAAAHEHIPGPGSAAVAEWLGRITASA